jgi:hypothetical protein
MEQTFPRSAFLQAAERETQRSMAAPGIALRERTGGLNISTTDADKTVKSQEYGRSLQRFLEYHPRVQRSN